VGKDLRSCKIALVGAGAANIRFAHIAMKAGAEPENMVLVDSKGIITSDRKNLKQDFPEKYELAKLTNKDNRKGGIPEALDGTDVLIAASTPGPDTVKADWLKKMNDEAIVFVLANPVPEIWPWDAKKAGARIVATGRSDFANQVNNSLGFPGILRGILDVRASAITDEMCVTAAKELASVARDQGINEDYILPTMESIEVFAREAAAVGEEAQREGLAKVNLTRKQIYDQAVELIQRAREIVAELRGSKIVKLPPTHETLFKQDLSEKIF
jgi:malate dehydrogenase (oxaloacetate-decarboxylating)